MSTVELFIIPTVEEINAFAAKNEEAFFEMGQSRATFSIDENGNIVMSVEKNLDIEITGCRPTTKDDKVVGYADVKIGGNVYNDLRVIKSIKQPGTMFVDVPQKMVDIHGQKRYFPVFHLDREVFDVVQEKVIAAVVAAKEVKAANTPAPEEDLDEALNFGRISNLLHSKVTHIDGVEVKLTRSSNMRYVDLNGLRFIQQNPGTGSAYAKQVLAGHQVTQIYTLNGPWKGAVVDTKFETR
jgi:hypothetical protein